MPIRVAIPDMVSPSYFPAIAAVELGFFAAEGLDATVELIFPVTKTFEELREGRIDFVGGAAHAALYAFRDWRGCKLLCALSQNMYWFLVVRRDRGVKRGELQALKGLRIGAAPGPVDGLKRMLAESGIDPERDVKIAPVPAASGAGVSFGMAAAKALEEGAVDAFWANGMAAEVAVRRGNGSLVIDARTDRADRSTTPSPRSPLRRISSTRTRKPLPARCAPWSPRRPRSSATRRSPSARRGGTSLRLSSSSLPSSCGATLRTTTPRSRRQTCAPSTDSRGRSASSPASRPTTR
jgi:hypothetical protein